MIINMWSTGELRREFKSHDSKVYMKITRPLCSTAEPVCIMVNNAHLYYPESSDELVNNIPLYRYLAVEKLKLPDEMGTLRRFCDFVQDGFDELCGKSPVEDDRDKQLYGEVEVQHGDLKFTKEMRR